VLVLAPDGKASPKTEYGSFLYGSSTNSKLSILDPVYSTVIAVGTC
jgi:hypothetical protein